MCEETAGNFFTQSLSVSPPTHTKRGTRGWLSHVYDPLRFSPRMDPGAPRTGGKLGKQLTFPGGDPLGSLGSE